MRKFLKKQIELKLVSAIIYLCENRKKVLLGFLLLVIPIVCALGFCGNLSKISLSAEGNISFSVPQLASTEEKRSVISIPTTVVKQNPFLPCNNIDSTTSVSDVPKQYLVEPPESISESSDAVRLMDTIVSGILYDDFSPSAILNIEGNDYLVKKGDVVNNYKILNITRNSVAVKLGENSYSAGIGEILTEGEVNHSNIPNLNNKFGGVQ